MRQKIFLHCAMDHNTVHELNEECVHVKNTGFDLETIKRCTDHPRVIPNLRTKETTDAQTGSADIIGGMKHMKDSGQRRAWTDIRRGVFTPEPLTDMDEHWIEVTERSEMMCDVCKSFIFGDRRMDTNTENRTSCLNCASNWTRSGTYMVLKSLAWTSSHRTLVLLRDCSMFTTAALTGERSMQKKI